LKFEISLTTKTRIKKRLDDYDRLTDWIRPLARGLAIYSLTAENPTFPAWNWHSRCTIVA